MTAAATPCPGRCNHAHRQAQRERADAIARWDAVITTCTTSGEVAEATRLLGPRPLPLEPAWVTGAPVWCARDSAAIRQRLAQLGDLAALLAADVAGNRGPAGDTDKVTTSQGHPSPSPAVDDLDEILRTLEHHEGVYRARRQLAPAPDRAAELRVDLAVAFLLGHLGDALAHPRDGVALGRDVTRLHARARARTHSDEAKRRMPAPCPRCDLKSLVFTAGETYVSCESCGRLMLLPEYEEHVLELAKAGTT